MKLPQCVRFSCILAIIVNIISFIIFSDSIAAQDQEARPSLAHLTKFVGKYPSFETDKTTDKIIRGKSLTDDPAFRQALMKALGRDRFKIFMDQLDVEAPIERNGQIIYFWKAKPHFACYFNANVFINLADNSVEVFWHDSDYNSYWLSSRKKPRLVPKDNRLLVKDNGGWILKNDDSMSLFNTFGNR